MPVAVSIAAFKLVGYCDVEAFSLRRPVPPRPKLQLKFGLGTATGGQASGATLAS